MQQLRLWETETAPARLLGTIREQLERRFAALIRERFDLAEAVSYKSNKEVPLLRLYRYKEAFAYAFVRELIRVHKTEPPSVVLDPFCGMGTTLLASTIAGVPSWGVDRLPVGVFVANALLQMLDLEPGVLRECYEQLVEVVPHLPEAEVASDVAIMRVAFEPLILNRLRQWKTAILSLQGPEREVMALLLLSALESCSYTSKDGQFLRLRRDKKPLFPDTALQERVLAAERDLQLLRSLGWKRRAPAIALLGDARMLPNSPFRVGADLVITSPPYANRYDYTRSYSLELCFFFVKNFEELKHLRHSVLRSHIEARVAPAEQSSHPAVQEVVALLKAQRHSLNNPRIPDMITAYFVDMERVVNELARACATGATVYLVVDNVRFEGEVLPVDLILCDLAEQAGFRTEAIWVARYKGNSSQQMGRYGRVPVRESVLVWRKRDGRACKNTHLAGGTASEEFVLPRQTSRMEVARNRA